MELSLKLRKLFTGEALLSAWEHALRHIHYFDVNRVLATLDPMPWVDFRKRYPVGPEYPPINRFADAAYWIGRSVERAQDLWLDRSAPLRILDLGCGAGYFAYVCRFLGHECVGLDVDEQPLFREATQLLQVPRIVFRIARRQSLPDLGNRFDLVTAYLICFHKMFGENSRLAWWHPEDWEFFLHDVRTHVLKAGGKIILDFNPVGDGSYYSPEVRKFFTAQGARIFRSKVFFGAESAAET
jgi:SAM-dependent methyltransferase